MSDKVRSKYVGNIGPSKVNIAFVGEAPGETEETGTLENNWKPEPFLGWAGEKLIDSCKRNGLTRENAFFGNLCNFRPAYGNRFGLLLGTTELSESFKRLHQDLLIRKPNVIVALGSWPLNFLTSKQGKSHGAGIGLWRGSIIKCSLPGLENTKVIPTYHPSAVNRDRTLYPIFNDDIKKAISDSTFPEFNYRERKFITEPSDDELEYYTQEFLKADKLAVDVENFKGAKLACIGFAPSPDIAMCIPMGNSFHAIDCMQRLLLSPIPKILQFGTHDSEVIHLNLNVEINNYFWDTMTAQVVMWPGLPASLAYLTSVYTREPYYKEERKSEEGKEIKSWSAKFNRDKLWRYNCKDCCVTYEIQEAQEKELNEGPKGWKKTFAFQMSNIPRATRISRAGMFVDQERKEALRIQFLQEWFEDQVALESLIGNDPTKLHLVRIKNKDVIKNCKANVNSKKQIATLVYDILGLKVHYARKENEEGNKSRTVDKDALIAMIAETKDRMDSVKKIATKTEWARKHLIVKLIHKIRGTRKRKSSYSDYTNSPDGRLRGTFKTQSAKFGRWGCEKYVDGTGIGLQTFPRD